jgi:FkbM family methyltransferase
VDWSGKTVVGRHVYGRIVDSAMGRTQRLTHREAQLVFAVPNGLSRLRVDTFSTKEPETLEWIDQIPRGSVLWDIGANVGLYSCYAAKARSARVIAFEPSVFNLELLARNVFLNALTESVTIVPLPLSELTSIDALRMTATDWGAALSTFGQFYGHDGKPIRKVFEYPTLGISMLDAVELLRLPRPDYIKMDVDGIEHLILKGGIPVLREVRSLSIEINDSFENQAHDASKYLLAAGLSFRGKRHAEQFDSHTGAAKDTFNQVWSR